MAAAVKITSVVKIPGQLRVQFNITLSGSYATGGDVIDFTNYTLDTSFQGEANQISTSQPPVALDIWDQSGNVVNQLSPVLGTTLANSKIKIGAASTFGTEFSAGAYSAGLLASKLVGEAVFNTPML